MLLQENEHDINRLFSSCAREQGFIDVSHQLLLVRILNTRWVCSTIARSQDMGSLEVYFRSKLSEFHTTYNNDSGRRLELKLWDFMRKIIPQTSLTEDKIDRCFKSDILVPWNGVTLSLQITTHRDIQDKKEEFFSVARTKDTPQIGKIVLPIFIYFEWSRIHGNEQESIFLRLGEILRPLLAWTIVWNTNGSTEPIKISDKKWCFHLWINPSTVRHNVGELTINAVLPESSQ